MLIKDMKKFESTKDGSADFVRFYEVATATKTIPQIALMIDAESERSADEGWQKMCYGNLGIVVKSTFYEVISLVLDDFFQTTTEKQELLAKLDTQAPLKFDKIVMKTTDYDALSFDKKTSKALSASDYDEDVVLQKLSERI